jgi:hypothetical protein
LEQTIRSQQQEQIIRSQQQEQTIRSQQQEQTLASQPLALTDEEIDKYLREELL